MKKISIPVFLLITLAIGLSSCRGKNPVVEIQTAKGNFLVEIYLDKAPVTAGNFINLVKKGVYEGGTFYRTVRGDNDTNPVVIQVLQGGVGDKELGDEIKPIAHETTDQTGIRHLDGVISMARSKPGTARTEFFICIGDQKDLDIRGLRNADGQGFAAFGKVIEGMEVVQAIWSSSAQGQRINPPVSLYKVQVK